MKISELDIKGPLLISPEMNEDSRGEFGRILCTKSLKEIGVTFDIKQVNHSITHKKGTIRGMHFQYQPKEEAKLVKCIRGNIYDVIVDMRRFSPTFLHHITVNISEKNKNMLYIPPGFAHGFQTLVDNVELIYFHSDFYSPEHEGGLRFDDSKLNIIWPLNLSEISQRDLEHSYIKDNFKGI